MNTVNRFTKGSGCYTCRSCGIKTRDTGYDGPQIQLCNQCFELAGYDNQVSDSGIETLTSAEIADIRRMGANLIEKGGVVDFENLNHLFSEKTDEVFYLVTITGPDTELLMAVDAQKSSRARRAARQELKAAGIDTTSLKFNACRA